MSLSGPAARHAWGAVLVAILCATTAGSAQAQSTSKSACISDFEHAVELRAGRKLLDARQRLLACGSVRCPVDVQKECVKELVLVEQSLPSIVLALRDEAGHDIVDARTFVDGEARALDGQALSLDPGRHAVRFEMTGCESAEQLVLLAEGEKNRAIVGTLRCGGPTPPSSSAPPPSPTSSPASSAAETPATSSVPSATPSRTLPLVLAGVGIVGLAGFAYFGLQGRADIDDVRSTGCAPSCDRDAVMHARTKLLVADVLGGVGLVSLGAAAWLFFSGSAPAPSKRAFTLDVRPGPNGGAMLLRGLF
jgi:hypothetical protein